MKTAAFIVALLFLVPGALAATTDYSSGQVTTPGASLYVVAANYEPSPLAPGQYADIWLKIENRGERDAENVEVTLPDKFPFKALEGSTKELGTLSAKESAIAYFRVQVDAGAPSGPTRLRVRLETGSRVEEMDILLQLERLDAVLAIDDVKTTPSIVAAGETVKVDVTVRNMADTSLRSVRATLRLLTQVTTTTGLSTVELPFTPIGGGIERTIDILGPGDIETFTFNLVVDPDAESKPYKLPVHIVYYDANGANRTRDEVVGVIVGSEPELTVYMDDNEFTSEENTGRVVVRFVNHGVSDIKFLTARLDQTDEFVIINSPESYVGKIDSDDYETAEWQLALTKKADDVIELPIVMQYRDANNKQYSAGVSVNLVRFTPEQLGMKKSATGAVIAVIVIIAVIGWYAYNKKRKKK